MSQQTFPRLEPSSCSTPPWALLGALVLAGCSRGTVAESDPAAALIGKIAACLDEAYVDPTAGSRLAAELRSRLAAHAYPDPAQAEAFCSSVNADFARVAQDRHLRLVETQKAGSQPVQHEGPIATGELMPGGIGYLKIDALPPLPEARDRLLSALREVEDARALVLDLTDNGGGDPRTVVWLASRFFDERPLLLNTIQDRSGRTVAEMRTTTDIGGPRMAGVPLVVLIGPRTFSAGEELAYDLQAQERALVMGRASGGGANPTSSVRLDERFTLILPDRRSVNPVTGTNWEGVGVVPDEVVPLVEAKSRAHARALAMIGSSLDPGTQAPPPSADAMATEPDPALSAYLGGYGIRRITFEDSGLVFRREDEPPIHLNALGTDVFMMDDGRTRVRFTRDAGGRVDGFAIERANGEVVNVRRDP